MCTSLSVSCAHWSHMYQNHHLLHFCENELVIYGDILYRNYTSLIPAWGKTTYICASHKSLIIHPLFWRFYGHEESCRIKTQFHASKSFQKGWEMVYMRRNFVVKHTFFANAGGKIDEHDLGTRRLKQFLQKRLVVGLLSIQGIHERSMKMYSIQDRGVLSQQKWPQLNKFVRKCLCWIIIVHAEVLHLRIFFIIMSPQRFLLQFAMNPTESSSHS